MKKEELTALGMTDEQAEKVLEMHGKEQNESASKLSEAENKLAAAEKNAKELTEKVKAFDGVDLEALRKSAADWETKYNTDIAKAKLDSAVELALTRAGAKDVDLARHLIDTSILKLDGDKVVGLAEQLEKAKTDKAFLFGDDAKETARIDTGIDHGGATDTISDAQIRAVMGLPAETK